MLARMWNNSYSHSLLVGVQHGTAPVETSWWFLTENGLTMEGLDMVFPQTWKEYPDEICTHCIFAEFCMETRISLKIDNLLRKSFLDSQEYLHLLCEPSHLESQARWLKGHHLWMYFPGEALSHLCCEGWGGERKLGHQGRALALLPKACSELHKVVWEMLSGDGGSRSRWGGPASHFCFPGRFLGLPITLWEVHYDAADSNKLQHLQPAGHWWWGWNQCQIHCPWTRMGPHFAKWMLNRSRV